MRCGLQILSTPYTNMALMTKNANRRTSELDHNILTWLASNKQTVKKIDTQGTVCSQST